MAAFEKGHAKVGGRKAGTPNKTTTTLKEAILLAFDKVGGADYLVAKARDNPTAFLSILARVLPTEVAADLKQDIVVKIMRFSEAASKDEGSDGK